MRDNDSPAGCVEALGLLNYFLIYLFSSLATPLFQIRLWQRVSLKRPTLVYHKSNITTATRISLAPSQVTRPYGKTILPRHNLIRQRPRALPPLHDLIIWLLASPKVPPPPFLEKAFAVLPPFNAINHVSTQVRQELEPVSAAARGDHESRRTWDEVDDEMVVK